MNPNVQYKLFETITVSDEGSRYFAEDLSVGGKSLESLFKIQLNRPRENLGNISVIVYRPVEGR